MGVLFNFKFIFFINLIVVPTKEIKDAIEKKNYEIGGCNKKILDSLQHS